MTIDNYERTPVEPAYTRQELLGQIAVENSDNVKLAALVDEACDRVDEARREEAEKNIARRIAISRGEA